MTTPDTADVTAYEATPEPETPATLEGAYRRIVALEARVAVLAAAVADAAPNDHLPEECRRRACTYYQGYLAYGAPVLTHEGYHAAERMAQQHVRVCAWDRRRGPCALCDDWERRLRF